MAGKCGCTTWVPPLQEGGHEEAWGSRCISPAFLAGYRPCPEPVLGGSGICSLRATWDDGRLHCVPRCGNGVSASFVKSGLGGAMAAAPAGDMGEPCNCSGCYRAGLGKRALYPSYNFSVKVLENAFFFPFFSFLFSVGIFVFQNNYYDCVVQVGFCILSVLGKQAALWSVDAVGGKK